MGGDRSEQDGEQGTGITLTKGCQQLGDHLPAARCNSLKKLQSKCMKIDASASLTLYLDMTYQLNVLRQKEGGASSDFRCLHSKTIFN